MANLDLTYGSNDRVRAFENHNTGLLISLAGPGTGKTFSFLKRIRALTARGILQDTVCYLTFIKEISKAFIQDYIQEFTKESYEANKPRISTLHSFACRLLRNQGYQIGYNGVLYFINSVETETDAANTLLEDLLPLISSRSYCHTVPQIRDNLEKIKAAWRDIVDPTTLPDPIPIIVDQANILFRALRVIDWDNTIPLASQLAARMETLPRWITDIKHYLIDEFQDFNKAEQALIAFLSSHATSTVIVGDDDQSLYSSRGGSPTGLTSMYADLANDHVSLVNCHRCRTTIVNAANTFQRVLHATPRQMIPIHAGGEILAYRFKSSNAEISFLVTFLQECITNLPETITPKDGTVCLFPSWKVLDEYYKRLSPLVPCFRRRAFPSSQRLWLERVLNLLFTPNQRFIERLLLNEYDQIKPRHKRLIIDTVINNDITVFRAVQLLLSQQKLTGAVVGQAQQFCQLIEDIASHDPDRISLQISSKLVIGVVATTVQISALLTRLDESEIEDLIKEYADLILPDSIIPEEDPRSILFLTMHGSKGLTKKVVVMPGLERAWLPGDSSGSELEEKKRLFFVALTRATHRVLVTYPLNRIKGDSLNYNAAGRKEVCNFLVNSGINVIYHP